MSTSSRDGAADRDGVPTGVRRAPVGPRVVGAVLFAIGVFLLYTAYSELGDAELTLNSPRFTPIVVSIMWVLFSGVYLARQIFWPGLDYPDAVSADVPPADTANNSTSDDDPDGDSREHTDWRPPLMLAGLLAAYAVALDPLGFVVSTMLFYFGASWVLGSRKPAREAIIAVALAFGVYYGMTAGLDISLPSGVLPL